LLVISCKLLINNELFIINFFNIVFFNIVF